jgi:hypothetical protein
VSKPGLGQLLPAGQVDSAFGRAEPIITPAQLVSRYTKGIPLASKLVNPFTGKVDVWTQEDVQEEIGLAINALEVLYGFDIMPVQHAEKYEFNRLDYSNFGYLRLRHKPVSSIEEFAIVPSNNVPIFEVPLSWVETAYLEWGQLNIVPLTIGSTSGAIPAQATGGAVFLSILSQSSIIPAYWQLTYTTGWANGVVPVVINELIGNLAAEEILSKILASYIDTTSHSVGMDGMSQSVGQPQVALLTARIEQLAAKREALAKKLRRNFGQGIVCGAI